MTCLKWWGISNRAAVDDVRIARQDAIADAGRDGQWEQLLELVTPSTIGVVDDPRRYVNSTRVGGLSQYAPLHHAAAQGASAAMAERLIELGAWRTLRCSSGHTPLELAESYGHWHLYEVLTPRPQHQISDRQLAQLEYMLHAVIVGRVSSLVRTAQLRLPQLGPLTEVENPTMWFPIPGMDGGFKIVLHSGGTEPELQVESWSRPAKGSGQRHRVRTTGFELVDKGFAAG
ncbi:hypothetical protein ACWDYH_06385 [Nocardia goodfellowii]